MNSGLKDILSNLNSEVDQETLLKYLQGKLSASEQHELEKQMLDEGFEADAVEGLTGLQDKKKIEGIIEQLNLDLKKRTEKKKRFRQKLRITIEPWILAAIILILLLAIIGFVLVYRQAHLQH